MPTISLNFCPQADRTSQTHMTPVLNTFYTNVTAPLNATMKTPKQWFGNDIYVCSIYWHIEMTLPEWILFTYSLLLLLLLLFLYFIKRYIFKQCCRVILFYIVQWQIKGPWTYTHWTRYFSPKEQPSNWCHVPIYVYKGVVKTYQIKDESSSIS